MTDEKLPRLEHLLDLTARRVSGSSVHPLEIVQRVVEAVEAGVRDGIAPNDIRVTFHPSDFERYSASLAALRNEIARALEPFERRRGLRRIGERTISFARSGAAEGHPAIAVAFANSQQPVNPRFGVTRRVARIEGVALIVEGTGRVPLTHLPFLIGRAAGNDLVLTSLSVSRAHAEVVREGGEFVLRDLDSHNGLVVDGKRYETVHLANGLTVLMGDISLLVEMAE